MNEIKVNLENLNDTERKQLLELIEKANKSKSKVWKPEYNVIYWYIGESGNIYQTYNTENKIDKWNITSGNCYKTKEDAKFAKERKIVTQELQDYANEYNKYDFDWNNAEQYKYFLYCDYETTKRIFVYWANVCRQNEIYFTSKEIAEAAVKAVGEERVLKYYLGVDD